MIEEKICGQIIKNIFYNEDDFFNISKIITEEKQELFVKGYFPKLNINTNYEFIGNYVFHPKYGKQFDVISYKIIEDNKNIVSYLSSDLFYGIGEKTAQHIVDVLGDDALNLIIKDKTVLDKTNLSAVKKERLYSDLRRNKALESVILELTSYGLSLKMMMRLYEKYGSETINVINRNPYRLIDEIDGFSFKKCDELALKKGISPEDENRLLSGIIYVLKENIYERGNTYLYENELLDLVSKKLNKTVELPINTYEKALLKARVAENIKYIDNKFYLKASYNAEVNVADKLREISQNKTIRFSSNLIASCVKHAELKLGITYTEKQKEAIIQALSNPFVVITGGPGVGKTTIIKGILHLYAFLNNYQTTSKEFLKEVCLMAPTGRASKRMSETTNIEAKTIHRTLGYDLEGNFLFNEDNPLFKKLIIVDESSMIDIFLASSLCKALTSDVQIIFVGDINQLPSVGPGAFLRDIIASQIPKTIYLTQIMRQAQDSNIVLLSSLVNEGKIDYSLFNKCDVFFQSLQVDNLLDHISYLLKRMLNSGYKLDDMQILVPMYKGIAGIDAINEMISNNFNQNPHSIIVKNKTFKVNDRVIQNVNNAIKNVMNGDVGVIVSISSYYENGKEKKQICVVFDKERIYYKENEIDELSLAYAISIHRSQGSEYKVVILPLFYEYFIMLKRKILYTAITRAKKILFMLGEEKAFKKAVLTLDENRQTTLKQLLVNEKEYPKNMIKIDDPNICFDYLGEENMENISPYTFMEKA